MSPEFKLVSRRVFVVWVNPIFRDAVLILLQHPEVEYVGSANNDEDAVQNILSAQPDTILAEEMEGQVSATLLDLFERSSFRGRLVSLNLIDNRLRVYRREEWTALHADDLLHLILH